MKKRTSTSHPRSRHKTKYNMHKWLKQFVSFALLNTILLAFHGSSVPKRDQQICLFGLVCCLLAINTKHDKFGLERTKLFRTWFALVTISEVLFTIVAPWVLILIDSNNGYFLAPHLFVFQSQIALEGILFMKDGNSLLIYYFTAIANLYRGLALATWALRSAAAEFDDSLPLALTLLPAIAIFLWVCSNLFILLGWYPCIHRLETSNSSEGKK